MFINYHIGTNALPWITMVNVVHEDKIKNATNCVNTVGRVKHVITQITLETFQHVQMRDEIYLSRKIKVADVESKVWHSILQSVRKVI